jgi:hypothetical protein
MMRSIAIAGVLLGTIASASAQTTLRVGDQKGNSQAVMEAAGLVCTENPIRACRAKNRLSFRDDLVCSRRAGLAVQVEEPENAVLRHQLIVLRRRVRVALSVPTTTAGYSDEQAYGSGARGSSPQR